MNVLRGHIINIIKSEISIPNSHIEFTITNISGIHPNGYLTWYIDGSIYLKFPITGSKKLKLMSKHISNINRRIARYYLSKLYISSELSETEFKRHSTYTFPVRVSIRNGGVDIKVINIVDLIEH